MTRSRLTGIALLLATVCTVLALPAQAAETVSPGTFEEVSSGVALINTFGCRGKPLGQGTGFLVGTKIVMTARHVTQGACRVRVRVGGGTYFAARVDSWYGGGASQSAADLATIKLNRAVTNGYVFRVRSNRVPAGLNLGTAGYPLGNRLSFNQGKIIWRGKIDKAPILAVRMLGAEGASGSPFIDADGRVVGVLQIGLSKSKDVLGQRTSGVLMGLDLVRWWGPRARLDLCRAYPSGGIAGCPGATPQPPPATEKVEVVEASVSATEDGPAQTSFVSSPQVTLYLRISFAAPTKVRHTATDYAVGPSGERVPGCTDDIPRGWEGFVCEYTLTSPAPGSWRIVYAIDGRAGAVGFEVTGSTPPPAASPHIQQCWSQFAGSSTSTWNPSSATSAFSANDILSRGPENFAAIASMDPAPTADITGGRVTLALIQPNGQVFGTTSIPTWQAGYAMYGFDFRATWSDGRLFFQHPELTGQGAWTWRWTGPDGQTCSNAITIS